MGTHFTLGFAVALAALAVLAAALALKHSLRVIWNYPTRGHFRWHFAGFHSGFYDQYLDNRVRFARHALAIDETRDAAGMQHSEVDAVRDLYPRWVPRRLRRSWDEVPRVVPPGAPYHATVVDRFALPAVQHYAEMKPYRPPSLSADPRLEQYYP